MGKMPASSCRLLFCVALGMAPYKAMMPTSSIRNAQVERCSNCVSLRGMTCCVEALSSNSEASLCTACETFCATHL